jgi:hypothetical protein
VPWTDFRPEEKKVMRLNLFGLWRDTAIYPARGHYIWGLTAKMITLAAFAPFRT